MPAETDDNSTPAPESSLAAISKRYHSPFNDRYGSNRMAMIWDTQNRWLRVRDIWIAQAAAQAVVGLVTRDEYEDLVAHRDNIDTTVIHRREFDRTDPNYTGHDVLAALSNYADYARVGARVLHQADTSEDTLSNEEMIEIRDSFEIIEEELVSTLGGFATPIEKYSDLVCMGYTHGQAAEPTTMGYRFANYAQDFLLALKVTRFIKQNLRTKGIKGAVGTSASFTQLLQGTSMTARQHESLVMDSLNLVPALITGQTYPRIFTFLTIVDLATIAIPAHRFAGDVKTLQGSGYRELAEPRASNDRSSSAMMHKRNPRHSENIKSLSRSVITSVLEAGWNAAEVTLERGIEDSAGKRSYLPEAFLAVDEILGGTERIIRGIQVREAGIKNNLAQFGPFVALETILTELSKEGAHRQEMDDLLRRHVATSLAAVEVGGPNPLIGLIIDEPEIRRYLTVTEITQLFDSIYRYVGDAPQRCTEFLEKELYPAIGK